MSRTKERRKSIQRQVAELAADTKVPRVVREQCLVIIGRTLEEAWQALADDDARRVLSANPHQAVEDAAAAEVAAGPGGTEVHLEQEEYMERQREGRQYSAEITQTTTQELDPRRH